MKNLTRKVTELIYLTYARANSQEEVIDVRNHLSQILTALVLTPERPEEFVAASQRLDDLQQIFSETQFHLLMAKDYVPGVVSAENYQIISYDPEQVGFHGLPKNEVLETIRTRHFDMVIDLNDKFSLLATSLCRASKAKLRICLQHPKRDTFYNFQVRADSSHNLKMKYDSLLKYLSVFKSLPQAPSRDLMPA